MSSFSDDIQRAFQPQSDLERLRLEAARTLNRTEWASYKEASNSFDAQRRYVRRSYELEYPARIAEERKRLINKAGSIKRNFVPRFLGNDAFNADAINRRAQMNVRAAHKNDLKRIDRSDLREGDILCFRTSGRTISHIGIYLKDDRFVHASRSSGVRISSLQQPYYQSRFIAAGRVDRDARVNRSADAPARMVIRGL